MVSFSVMMEAARFEIIPTTDLSEEIISAQAQQVRVQGLRFYFLIMQDRVIGWHGPARFFEEPTTKLLESFSGNIGMFKNAGARYLEVLTRRWLDWVTDNAPIWAPAELIQILQDGKISLDVDL